MGDGKRLSRRSDRERKKESGGGDSLGADGPKIAKNREMFTMLFSFLRISSNLFIDENLPVIKQPCDPVYGQSTQA